MFRYHRVVSSLTTVIGVKPEAPSVLARFERTSAFVLGLKEKPLNDQQNVMPPDIVGNSTALATAYYAASHASRSPIAGRGITATLSPQRGIESSPTIMSFETSMCSTEACGQRARETAIASLLLDALDTVFKSGSADLSAQGIVATRVLRLAEHAPTNQAPRIACSMPLAMYALSLPNEETTLLAVREMLYNAITALVSSVVPAYRYPVCLLLYMR
ncbi:hypothetical protein NM688_g745 [Phlebia brevispora]|uniref:Uncharacterized protein n=1 Tax=Phlebia brevispora TaxID=194682 RepID=A0ACC1TD95_9APHY|nr:hypothetical protein NM688_g745 [Phlebia brevispora]